jgi:hypothetical protein
MQLPAAGTPCFEHPLLALLLLSDFLQAPLQYCAGLY